MNRVEFIRRVAEVMRENNMGKPVSMPKQVFHISDDDGNKKDFTVQSRDKKFNYTFKDIESILDTCFYVLKEQLKNGDDVTIRGIGSLGLNYIKARHTKIPYTDTRVDIAGHYVPKFVSGKDLKTCAKIFESRLKNSETPKASFTEEDGEDNGA